MQWSFVRRRKQASNFQKMGSFGYGVTILYQYVSLFGQNFCQNVSIFSAINLIPLWSRMIFHSCMYITQFNMVRRKGRGISFDLITKNNWMIKHDIRRLMRKGTPNLSRSMKSFKTKPLSPR